MRHGDSVTRPDYYYYNQGLTIVSPYLYLALVSLVILDSMWILRCQCQSQSGLTNKNGFFVILQFTENDEIFF